LKGNKQQGKDEETFLQHIQQVLTEPRQEKEVGVIKNEEKFFSPNKTKK
jgi:hypothetical protein